MTKLGTRAECPHIIPFRRAPLQNNGYTRKAYGYVRVSGKGQLRGDGFVRQQLAIEDYAKRNGIPIVKTFKERAVPGATELENRPVLMALLAR